MPGHQNGGIQQSNNDPINIPTYLPIQVNRKFVDTFWSSGGPIVNKCQFRLIKQCPSHDLSCLL